MSGPKTLTVAQADPVVRIDHQLSRLSCRLEVPMAFQMNLYALMMTPADQRGCLREWVETSPGKVARTVQLSQDTLQRIQAAGIPADQIRQQFQVVFDLEAMEMSVEAQTILTEQLQRSQTAQRRTLMETLLEPLRQELLRQMVGLDEEFKLHIIRRAFESAGFKEDRTIAANGEIVLRMSKRSRPLAELNPI